MSFALALANGFSLNTTLNYEGFTSVCISMVGPSSRLYFFMSMLEKWVRLRSLLDGSKPASPRAKEVMMPTTDKQQAENRDTGFSTMITLIICFFFQNENLVVKNSLKSLQNSVRIELKIF